jgi:hypothetical protein
MPACPAEITAVNKPYQQPVVTCIFVCMSLPCLPPASLHLCSNIAILGLLLPSYSYTGMDGPCHMSEEVAVSCCQGIVCWLWYGGACAHAYLLVCLKLLMSTACLPTLPLMPGPGD